MKYTNLHDLPDSLVRAVTAGQVLYEKEADVSSTELVAPIQQVQLRWRHDELIQTDILESVWALLGSAVHSILERASLPRQQLALYGIMDSLVREILDGDGNESGIQDVINRIYPILRDLQDNPPEDIVERRQFYFDCLGWTVSCKPDYISSGILDDYKITKAWAVVAGAKPEWCRQLDINAFIAQINGVEVNQARIIAILKDWAALNTKKHRDYPDKPIQILQVYLSPEEMVRSSIGFKVRQHQRALDQPDDKLPPCTPDERWHRPDKWCLHKIQKNGQPAAKAWRCYDTEQEALKQRDSMQKGYDVQFRSGANVRCESYCPVKSFCCQYKRESLNLR